MVDRASFNSTWDSAAKSLPAMTRRNSGARLPVSHAEIENKFALLKEETARTLALIGKLRASPLYRMPSFDPRQTQRL